MTKFLVNLTLDGYDTQEEHDAACLEFIQEALDFSASSVTVTPMLPIDEPEEICQNTMLRVDGSKTSFRCTCGANVFSHMKDSEGEYYECHGCHTIYRGEKE